MPEFRPFAVLGRCWLHDPVVLGPDLVVESLGTPLNFDREVELVLALADRLGISPSPEFHAAARERLEGTEPTALAHFPSITAADFDDAWRMLSPELERVCDSVAFLTANAVEPIAIVLAEESDTFRARFFPPDDRALIHIGERPENMPHLFAAAGSTGEIALALSLMRTAEQTRSPDFRIFYYVEALEVLSNLVPGGGSLDADIRRVLKHVGLPPETTSREPSRDVAHVLAALRNVVAHGKPLDSATVEPWVADYLEEERFAIRVRDLVRDVIERLALSIAGAP